VFERTLESPPARFADGAWSTASFAPANRVAIDAPADPEAVQVPAIPPAIVAQAVGESDSWDESQLLVGRDGSIVTVNASSWTPGTRTTAFWRNGKAEVAGSEESGLDPSASFLTPDGALWNADRGKLLRFSNGKWGEAVVFDWPRDAGRFPGVNIGAGLRTVNDAGPAWILHDRRNELLIRLSYGPRFQEPRLEVVPLVEAGQSARLKVRDAIAWSKGELLLATDRGLRTLAIDGGKIAVPPLYAGGRQVSRLVRDRAGRLWLGGDGLAVLDADGKTLHALDELPMLGRSKIEALAADPGNAGGAIAAVGERGVLFVRVDAR